jgi:hypothetical protein
MAKIWLRRMSIFMVFVVLLSFTAWAVPKALDPTKKTPEKKARDRRWVQSSPYFLDRQFCRWVGLCGLHHLRTDPAARPGYHDWAPDDKIRGELRKRATSWEDGAPPLNTKRNAHDRRRVLREIPDYVTKNAPLVHLYSGEEFWPSDIKEHVEHMTVYVDDEAQNSSEHKWTLHNLHKLNELGGAIVLRSDDDVESRPDWLHSHENIPSKFLEDPGEFLKKPSGHPGNEHVVDRESSTWYDADKNHPVRRISDPRSTPFRTRAGKSYIERSRRQRPGRLSSRGHKPDSDGFSQAPAVLVVVDKGSGIVDAFWFFFYSYNLGQTVLGIRFGNHVGDWEHCMVRFEHGVPRGVFFSEHEGGQAYAWEAVEKSAGGRPIIYSAIGSHAMYPLPGPHPYIIPFNLLKDETDRGPLWDPALNKYAYHYDYTLDIQDPDDESDPNHENHKIIKDPQSLIPAAENPKAPTSWFHFAGRWGDEVYSLADERQWRLFGQYHYVTGPDGPKYKKLHRSKMCQKDTCRIAYELDPDGKWY